MKEITEVNIWINGTVKIGKILQAQGTSVTLGSSASFYYQILTETKEGIASGNLNLSGSQYAAWGADDNYVYTIIAEDLNLTIVGDWVEPS